METILNKGEAPELLFSSIYPTESWEEEHSLDIKDILAQLIEEMAPDLEAEHNLGQDWLAQVHWPVPFPCYTRGESS